MAAWPCHSDGGVAMSAQIDKVEKEKTAQHIRIKIVPSRAGAGNSKSISDRTTPSVFGWGEGDETLRLPGGVQAAERLSQNSIEIMRETIAARRERMRNLPRALSNPKALSEVWTVGWALVIAVVVTVVATRGATASSFTPPSMNADGTPIDRKAELREKEEAFYRDFHKREAWKAVGAIEPQFREPQITDFP